MKTLGGLVLLFCALAVSASAQTRRTDSQTFQVTSSTFQNNGELPLSTLSNIIVNDLNVCSLNGSPGGNQSPALSWSNVPTGTKSFVVVAYDVTAAFTHWGMYNISASTTGLPENAGVAGSTFGTQVINDFFIGAEYDGPCPPTGVEPTVHHYMFTVYAIDKTLKLPSSTNFSANAETLYQALIDVGAAGHILGTAKIVGLYSTTP